MKPPYLGDGGRDGGFMACGDAEAGSLGAGDAIEAEGFAAGKRGVFKAVEFVRLEYNLYGK